MNSILHPLGIKFGSVQYNENQIDEDEEKSEDTEFLLNKLQIDEENQGQKFEVYSESDSFGLTLNRRQKKYFHVSMDSSAHNIYSDPSSMSESKGKTPIQLGDDNSMTTSEDKSLGVRKKLGEEIEIRFSPFPAEENFNEFPIASQNLDSIRSI